MFEAPILQSSSSSFSSSAVFSVANSGISRTAFNLIDHDDDDDDEDDSRGNHRNKQCPSTLLH